MKDASVNPWFLLQGALVLLPALAGCTQQTSAGSNAATDDAASIARVGPGVAPPAPGPQPTSADPSEQQSIYRIRQPGSRVAVGSHVVIGGPAVQVTATSRDTLWIQEAGDSGTCDTGNDVVAYRAIVVTSKSPLPALERGQLVEVEGILEETNGRRTIKDAVIRPSGTVAKPYAPHCERDGDSLASDALDGVLVLTAGTTNGQPPPMSDGTWSLSPCFGMQPQVAIGGAMVTYSEWSASWHWVRGVITRSGSVPRIEPRDLEDILWRSSNDTCL